MTEYLTKRNGHWQFVRRVPKEFAHLDERGIVKLSTGIEIADDNRGIKASRVAAQMNRDLEARWHSQVEGKARRRPIDMPVLGV